MKEYQCSYCPQVLKSVKAHARHLSLEHDAYKDGNNIEIATILSLEEDMDRTLFLIRKFPECRLPDNGDLWLKFLQYWSGALIYDAQTQDYVLNDKEREKNHCSHRNLRWALAQLENVRRAAQKHREKDKKMHLKQGEMLPHFCILPSEEKLHNAEISEKAHKDWAINGNLKMV